MSLTSDIASALDAEGLAPGFAFSVVDGASFDRVAVVVPHGQDPSATAQALANLPVSSVGDAADDVWDRLAAGARRAMILRNQNLLIAAALTFRGRGRIIGPLRPDLLIRFGVSAWR